MIQYQQLEQIAEILILNGTLINCPGLLHGKMGLSVFFFHFARHTNNNLYEDYAMELISEIQTQIHNNSPVDYERGISGIGTAVYYLIKNNFIEADDDILNDFDQRMYRAILYDSWQDYSLYKGLTGYGRYWMTRLHQRNSAVLAKECLLKIVQNIKERLTDISDSEKMDVFSLLFELQQISGLDICYSLMEQYHKWSLQLLDIWWSLPRLGNSAMNNILQQYRINRYLNGIQADKVNVILEQLPDLDMDKPSANMGILNGYTGEGMMRLTSLNQKNISWLSLL